LKDKPKSKKLIKSKIWRSEIQPES
jgi:hypothetical protein